MPSNIPKDDYLAHWLIDQHEATDDQAWETREQEDNLRRVVEMAARLEIPATRTREAAWQDFQARIQAEADTSQPPARIRSLPRLSSLIRMAAAITALVVAGILIQRWLAPDPVTPSGLITAATPAQAEPLTHLLPDGSEAVLNDQSELTYDAEAWVAGTRQVQLAGEAFFRVKRGSTFTVETAQGAVTVRGTSFNVFSRKEKMEVICFSGEVAVSLKGSTEEAVVLTPGQAVRYTAGAAPEAFTAEVATGSPGWSEGVFAFREASLEQVLDEVRRQYKVDIDLQLPGEGGRFTGSFFQDDPLTTTLENICTAMGLEALPQADGTYLLQPAGPLP